MKENVLEPDYWAARLQTAVERHRAIYVCTQPVWNAIEDCHRGELARHVEPGDSILDVGCAWGRLLGLLPAAWTGDYCGVDISPDFISLASAAYPARQFLNIDARQLDKYLVKRYDWAVLISIRPMLIGYCGVDTWEEVHNAISKFVNRIMYLEYDVNDIAVIEEVVR